MNTRQLAACADRLQEFLTTMLVDVGRAERRRHGWLYVPAHGHAHDQPELEAVWVLIEWPKDIAAPTKYWFSNLPGGVSWHRLVQLAKLRWRVEQNYQQLKEELGLDHYEGRGWQGWHHHVTLVCLAYACLLLEQRRL